MKNKNLHTAINIVKAGFKVFPCNGYGEKYKNPVPNISWGNESTRDPKMILHWWDRHPYSIPSISLKNSAYFVLDADVKNGIDGITNLEQLFKENGTDLNLFAQTYTPSGGRHYYFRLPDSKIEISSTNNKMPDGIDVKGNNSCIIARSCITKEGLKYRRGINGNIRITDTPIAPDWLIQLLSRKIISTEVSFKARPEHLKDAGVVRYLNAILTNSLSDLLASSTGNRNNNLNLVSFKLGSLINVGFISYTELCQLLYKTAIDIGLQPWEAKQTIKRSVRQGSNHTLIIRDLMKDKENATKITITYKGNII